MSTDLVERLRFVARKRADEAKDHDLVRIESWAADRIEELEHRAKDQRETLDLAEHAIRQLEREKDRLLKDQNELLDALKLAVKFGCDHCSESITQARRIAAKFDI